MDLADEATGQRKSTAQSFDAMLEGRDIVRHFRDIVERHARRFVQLEEQQVGQGRLSALDQGR